MTVQKSLSLLSIGCIVLTLVPVNGCGDYQESFYSSLADADKAGAAARSWVPDELMPKSAHDIHEIGEVSPSTEWCSFQFSATDAESFRKNLKNINELPAAVRRVPNPSVSWWPAVLRGNLDKTKIDQAGLKLYIVEQPATSVTTAIYLFAVDWRSGQAYFYSTYES